MVVELVQAHCTRDRSISLSRAHIDFVVVVTTPFFCWEEVVLLLVPACTLS